MRVMGLFSAIFMTTMVAWVTASHDSGAHHVQIESCDDLHEVFDMAQTQYVNASMHPFADVVCDKFTTFSLGSGYDIDIFSTDNLENFFGNADFVNVRLEIVNGSKITLEPNIEFEIFEEGEFPDVNGGALYIGEGSTARFLNEFKTTNIGVRSETADDSDFPDHFNDGGCVVNKGYFRVDGVATMTGCENSGGGEGSPGRGGAIFNDVTGSVLLEGGADISEVSIIDDEGNNGGGIYNLGKVNIRGDSTFYRLRAEGGGAIFNGKDAIFNFRRGSNALFNECRAFDNNAGAVLNEGFFKFSGAAVFVDGSGSGYLGSQITIGNEGFMKLSDDSYFFRNKNGSPVYVEVGGELDYNLDRVSFIDNDIGFEEECDSIYFEEGDVCVE